MVAVTDTSPDATRAPAAVYGDAAAPARNIGVVPTASLLTGAAIATVWFWIPLTILIIGISSIPSGIGFALSVVVFIYLMRGVEHVERLRSEAVFGLRIGVPPRRISPYTGIQRWLHQLWLDISSARFWKATAHHYLRMAYDMLAAGIALALLVFAFLGPAADRDQAERRRRGAVVHVAAAGLAVGPRRGGRRGGDPGLRACR
jgi:Putative sensor